MKFIVLLFFSLLTQTNLANNKTKNIESDSLKELSYEQLFLEYRSNNVDSAIYYCDKSIELLKKTNNIPRLALRYTDKARALSNVNDFDLAHVYVEKSIALSKEYNLTEQLGLSYAEKGGLFYDQVIYDSAVFYSLKSLRILDSLKVDSRIASSVLGLVYGELNEPKKSQYYSEKIIQSILDAAPLSFYDSTDLSIEYINLGLSYFKQNDYNKARVYYMKSYELAMKLGSYLVTSYVSSNLANLYNEENSSFMNLDSALFYMDQSLLYGGKTKSQIQLLSSELFYGGIFTKQEKYEEAIIRFKNAEQLSLAIEDNKSFENIYYNLTNAYLSINSDSAIYYLMKYDSIKELNLNDLKIKSISELEVKFETEKKEAENNLLKKDLELKEQSIRNRTFIGIGVFIIVVLIAVVIYFASRRKRDLVEKNILNLEQKLLRVQMNPHFIFNSLSVIGNYVLENKKEESYTYLIKFGKLMRLILESSREDFIELSKEVEIINNFLLLHKLSLKDQLEFYVNIEDELDIEAYEVPPMMLQPFIENAIEHGISKIEGVGVIHVNIFEKEGMLTLEVKDNGIGFKKEQLGKSSSSYTSYAIQITKERIANIEKNKNKKILFSIDSLPNRGTKVSLKIG